MKTILMTVFFMTLSLGLNSTSKASGVVSKTKNVSHQGFMQTVNNQELETRAQLKHEVRQSLQTLTEGVKQTSGAIIDVVMSIIAYAFLSVGQILSATVLDRS